eukprot:1130119-Pleurochrysis_carterae.AAC.5
MESDATSLDVSRANSSLIDRFSGPTDPCRARFPQLHQPANVHREARTHTVLIADNGARFCLDDANLNFIITGIIAIIKKVDSPLAAGR